LTGQEIIGAHGISHDANMPRRVGSNIFNCVYGPLQRLLHTLDKDEFVSRRAEKDNSRQREETYIDKSDCFILPISIYLGILVVLNNRDERAIIRSSIWRWKGDTDAVDHLPMTNGIGHNILKMISET
jgi:hypothetical protein